MYIFYNNDKIIVGISKVMYREKWYTVLYKSSEIDYLIIKYKGEYVKIDKSDVDDCSYNNITTDKDGNIVLMKGEQLSNLIGKRVYTLVQETSFLTTRMLTKTCIQPAVSYLMAHLF